MYIFQTIILFLILHHSCFANLTFECPHDGNYPAKKNCISYFKCSGGQAEKMICPKRQRFDVLSKKCVLRKDAFCMVAPFRFKCPRSDGKFPIEGFIRQYYQCLNSKPYRRFCGWGTGFLKSTSTCENITKENRSFFQQSDTIDEYFYIDDYYEYYYDEYYYDDYYYYYFPVVRPPPPTLPPVTQSPTSAAETTTTPADTTTSITTVTTTAPAGTTTPTTTVTTPVPADTTTVTAPSTGGLITQANDITFPPILDNPPGPTSSPSNSITNPPMTLPPIGRRRRRFPGMNSKFVLIKTR